MIRYARPHQALAVALAALAGFVDALGFLTLGGTFVSFMSGNSTRLAVGLAGALPGAATAAAVVALFVAGVAIGSLAAARAGTWREPAILGGVALALALAALLHAVGADRGAVAAMTLAMGALNAVFQRDGEVSVGVTYMTGALVKAGQRIAGALSGGPRWAWLPYVLLWLGLVAGAAAGATAWHAVGLGALWAAAGVAALLTPVARKLSRAAY